MLQIDICRRKVRRWSRHSEGHPEFVVMSILMLNTSVDGDLRTESAEDTVYKLREVSTGDEEVERLRRLEFEPISFGSPDGNDIAREYLSRVCFDDEFEMRSEELLSAMDSFRREVWVGAKGDAREFAREVRFELSFFTWHDDGHDDVWYVMMFEREEWMVD
jgi:hypothetical protein